MVQAKVTREAVIKNIISIFIKEIGFFNEDEKKAINENTHIVKDFKVDGDDISFFLLELGKYFSIKPSLEEWGKAVTIHQLADLIIKYLEDKP